MEDEKTNVLRVSPLVRAGKSQPAYLTVFGTGPRNAANHGRMYKLEQPQTVLGRSLDSDVVVDDDGISRKHAKVVASPDGTFQIVDLGSTNGTYVNDELVTVYTLKNTDTIQIGTNTVFKFVQDAVEEQYQRGLYESAVRDGLTGIYNKKYFQDALRQEFAISMRHQAPLALILFDLDHFKAINDTYGHPAGDYVLKKVAERVSATVRTEDVFARYGGEEFAIMVRQASEAQAIICAERCRAAINGSDFVFAGTPLRVTISLGVADLAHGDFARAEDLVATADRYLYRAKHGGRNRVDCFGISGP